ncbi:PREDICTED: GTP cyclohydrolase 1-like [Nelumbo nucifera]|uniref:GTP cyclohydrolase 1 n=1 Tax=Nelumbo nucifera TaxID=4432 RepID=A0A1U7ZUY4_NELNU|nr:PREDICTED: GTP cyclohydrolase 1-like [Nelumbo nucifera]XP_010252809.1 PREDICTED: GTP cyclohydrolase 1-like [Nelumbo nucifera]
MGALDEGHFIGTLENGVKPESLKLDLEHESETAVIEDAVKVLLQGLGEDSNREGLKKTPVRVAKALREGTRGYRQKVKDIVQGALFPEAGLYNGVGHAGGAGGLVVVRDLDLFSYCESCLLPFQVKCHVGYVPSGQRVVGLSKLSRVADVFAKRLQGPQRLANEVCLALHNAIKPAGVAVLLQCWHIQFPEVECSNAEQSNHLTEVDMPGWEKISVTSGLGVFENEKGDCWVDFLSVLKFRGVNVQNNSQSSWCPCRSLDVLTCNGHTSTRNSSCRASTNMVPTQPAMITAVTTILQSLGEDPLRKELVGTPQRFVHWLMNFKRSNLEMKLNGFYSSRMGLLSLQTYNGNISSNQDEIQSVLNLPFWSQCEHHLLPFHGVVHIGYFHPHGADPVGRSTLQSITHFYGCKLQVQERLTRQIAETVSSMLGEDVVVVVEANHICMISRGIEKVGSSTATIAVLGRFSTDPNAKAMFLQTISNSTGYGRT